MRTNRILLIITIFMTACNLFAAKNLSPTMVKIQTNHGDILVKLYDETPLHRDNFLKLAKQGFYDGVLFHRVIGEFMIQTGDPQSKDAKPDQMLGTGGPGYTVPAEIHYPAFFHKRGALAAARQGDEVNPDRASSGSQFYIVQGRTCSENELNHVEQSARVNQERGIFQQIATTHIEKIKALQLANDTAGLNNLRDSIYAETVKKVDENPMYKLTDELRQAYKTLGGTPHLDGSYTVFGEVVSGLEVVEEISKVKTGRADRPVEDVKIIKVTVEE
nr:peptidylprolyl isomerase [Paludibacter jiangxiensis]